MNSGILELIGIDPGYIIITMLILNLILVILVVTNMVKTGNLKKKYQEFMKGKDGKSLESEILKRIDEIDHLSSSNQEILKDIETIFANMKITYQKTGIVKYDAFNEMGGKLSFALALLDQENNGYLINAMHTREGCYTYIKEIIHGESYIVLAEEEKKALDQAISGKKKARKKPVE